ncbi:MAG: PKD domain-containing protein [Bacteroidota bacterium]
MKKNFYSLLFGLILVVSPLTSWASHLMGLDISYECLPGGNGCTYRIYANVYYDCTGSLTQNSGWLPVNLSNAPNAVAEMSSFSITGNTPLCAPPTQLTAWTTSSFMDVTPVCPALKADTTLNPTGCLGTHGNPLVSGAAEAIYFADFDFCNVNCNIYNLTYGSCCRNGVITSLNNPGSNGLFTGSTQIDLGIMPCNSSPRFIDPVSLETVPPIAYICEGQLSTFNQGAFDADGDSLSYELGPCNSNVGNQVTYDVANGYTPSTPLGSTWDVSIDPITGDLTFTPAPTGAVEIGVICIVVREWRNGVQIGQVVRDIQVTVLPAGLCPFPNPSTGGVQNVAVNNSGVGSLAYNQVAVCAGAEVCFDIPTISQDTSLEYTMYITSDLPGATFADAFNPAITDTITGANPTGRFCWTPPIGFRGNYFFKVTLVDDACPFPGINQFTIIINVFDGESAFTTTYDRLGCNEVELAVIPNNIIPGFNPELVNVEWYGNGNLEFNPNTLDSALTHFYPAPDTYFYSVLVTDQLGCTNTLTGIVPLETGAIADAGEDITFCSNLNFELGTPAITGQTYTWNPSANLSAPNIAQPNFSYLNTADTTAFFNYVLTVSDGTCTTFDYVTVAVNASVEASITPAVPEVCFGDSITLTAVPNIGDATSTQFVWSTGDTTESIRVAPDVNTTYSVVIFSDSAGGCSSLPTDIEVRVINPSTANISGDLSICPGQSTTLTATGGNSYLWSTGVDGSSITLNNFAGNDTTISVVPISSLGCVGLPDSVTITANPVPVAFFTNDIACEGTGTSLSDGSTIPTGNIVDWVWDFGDANSSGRQNPTHTYDTPGTYFARLTVTSDEGCSDSYLREVVVNPTPQVDFDLTNVCENASNQFTSTTTLANPATIDQWFWNYGDGGLDSGFQTTHTYGEWGFYNVELTVVSNQGCSNSFTKTAIVHPNPTADFRMESACADSASQFTNLATVPGDFDFVAEWAWDFGEDPTDPTNFSTSINPTHAYDNEGTYTVRMLVTTDKGCSDQIIKELVIYPHPVAEFTYDNTCEDDATAFSADVQIGATSSVDNYIWDFGNGMGIEGASRDDVSMTYIDNGGAGTYDVTLIAVATGNCSDTVTQQVVINPKPFAAYSVAAVCQFDSSQFVNLSTIQTGEISRYEYSFGDGRTTFGANPQHLYFEAGTYATQLIVTSDSGCTDNTRKTVRVHEIPTFSLFENDTVCFGDQARLLAVSSPENRVTWHLDDMTTDVINRGNSYITDPIPFDQTYFVQATGPQGCESDRFPVTAFTRNLETYELFASDSVVDMPQAIVNFALGSTGEILTYNWTFGDGTTSASSDPSHEYNAPGLYTVSVDIVDRYGCEASFSTQVEVKKISVIEVASAFTPNNDGVNETFSIKYFNVNNMTVQIFNRLGQKVFESDNPDFEWDGTKDGLALQEGVYVYTVRGTDLDGNNIEEVGTVTLLR